MALSSDLVSQFAKITKPETKPSEGTVVTGTAKEYDGDIYVQLDGSEQLTPIASSTAGIKDGDRVTVLIKSHTATVTGNVSDPSASQGTVSDIEQNVSDQISEFEILIADKVSTDQLEAESARIDNLVAENVTIKETLTAESAKISDLEADNVTINGKLEAAEADIDSLSTSKLDASVASITYAKIGDLEAISGEFHTLESDYAVFKNTTTDTLEANSADIDQIKADMITVDDFDAKYANIDFANIGEAAIEKLFSDSGIIGDLVMSDGHVTGTLVGVTIKGDLIEGNTIVADKLVIKGEDGLFYKLNTDGVDISAEQTEYNSLNGSVITAHSITAEKVNVDDLVAFNATIGGFHITENSIYSGVKSSATNTTRGVFMNDDGEFAIGDVANYLKFFKDTDGTYKLDISAASIRFGSDSTNLETAIGNITATVEEVHNASALIHEADGGVIDCGDTAGMPLAGLTVYGQTRQNLWVNPSTRTASGQTITANDDGSITISGAYTGNVGNYFAITYALKPGATYTVSVDKARPQSSGYGGFSVSCHSDTSQLLYVRFGGTVSGEENIVTFTVPSDTTLCRCNIIQATSITGTGTYRVMLNEGSEAQPWCPPGLDSVEDLYVNVSGGNLISSNPDDWYITSSTTVSIDGDSVTVSNSQGAYKYAGCPFRAALNGRTVCAGFESNESSGNAHPIMQFVYYVDGEAKYRTANNQPFTIPENATSVQIRLYSNNSNVSGAATVKFVKPYLRIDGEPGYLPLSMFTSTPIDLLGNKVSSLPDGTRDELTVDAGGNVVLRKNVGEYTYDGEETWGLSSTGTTVFTRAENTADLSEDNNIYCDRLAIRERSEGTGDYRNILAGLNAAQTANTVWLDYPGFSNSNILEFKEELAARPVRMLAKFAEQNLIPLGTIDLPDLPEQNAHVWISTGIQGLDPDIHATWYGENASALKDFASKAELKIESDQIRATVEETYATKEEVSTTYATKSEVTQTANTIKSEVSEEYVSKDDASATYATKTSVSTVEQTVDSLTSTVSSNYTTLNNKFGSYYTKTEVDQKDSSIKSTVSEVQTTANSALTKATTVEQTAEGLEVRLTQAEKDVDTAQSTANTAKTTATNAAKTATNYLKFDSTGLCVGDMTSGTLGYNTLIKSTGLHIRNGTEDLASFEVGTIDLGGIPIEDAGTQGVLNSNINFAGGSLDSKVYTTSGGRMETQLRLHESRGLSDLVLTADTATLGGPSVTLRADTGQILLSPVIGGVYKKSTSYEMFAGRRLYYNSSGTTGNVTLSESAANFYFLDILFANNDNYRDSVRVYAPNGNSVVLSNAVYKNEYTTTYVRNKVVMISGTSISVVSNRNGEAQVRRNNSCYATDATSVIKIYAVWGWK